MTIKKTVVIALALMLVFSLVACNSDGGKETRIGTSAFSIVIPEGYALTEDEMLEDQIAYYYKDDDSMDFDVYQWEKADGSTLQSEAEHNAAEHGTVANEIEINGIAVMKYISTEEYEGEVYKVVKYIFEDDTSFVGICFWIDVSEQEYDEIDSVINTLKKN